jgi:murein DD-endopeptidase MepM/ murein hydrolase activator NlpD
MHLKIPICSLCSYPETAHATDDTSNAVYNEETSGDALAIPTGQDTGAHQNDSIRQSQLDDAYNELPPALPVAAPAPVNVPLEEELPELPENQLTPEKPTIPAKKPAAPSNLAPKQPTLPAKPAQFLLPTPAGLPNFEWPVQGKVLAHYGDGKAGFSEGISISAPVGTNVKAASGGTVMYVGDNHDRYGKLLLIKHQGGFQTAYAHNAEILVKKGSKVAKGQVVAKIGKSGSVNTPQLHFSLRHNEALLNPEKVFTK